MGNIRGTGRGGVWDKKNVTVIQWEVGVRGGGGVRESGSGERRLCLFLQTVFTRRRCLSGAPCVYLHEATPVPASGCPPNKGVWRGHIPPTAAAALIPRGPHAFLHSAFSIRLDRFLGKRLLPSSCWTCPLSLMDGHAPLMGAIYKLSFDVYVYFFENFPRRFPPGQRKFRWVDFHLETNPFSTLARKWEERHSSKVDRERVRVGRNLPPPPPHRNNLYNCAVPAWCFRDDGGDWWWSAEQNKPKQTSKKKKKKRQQQNTNNNNNKNRRHYFLRANRPGLSFEAV